MLLIECRRVEEGWPLVELFHLIEGNTGNAAGDWLPLVSAGSVYLNRPDGFDQLCLSLIPVSLDSLIHQFYIYGL